MPTLMRGSGDEEHGPAHHPWARPAPSSQMSGAPEAGFLLPGLRLAD